MKTLYLVRHAKSSWENDISDHDRTLNERGITDGKRMAKYIASLGVTVDLMLSSTALRAKATAGFFCTALNIAKKNIIYKNELYDFSGQQVVDIITGCDCSQETIMIFGHNNAITRIANFYGDLQFDNVPTTGVVKIEFEIDRWEDLTKGKTTFWTTPKLINK